MSLSTGELTFLQYVIIAVAALVTLPLAAIWGIAIAVRGRSPIDVTLSAFGVRFHINTCPLSMSKAECERGLKRRITDKKES